MLHKGLEGLEGLTPAPASAQPPSPLALPAQPPQLANLVYPPIHKAAAVMLVHAMPLTLQLALNVPFPAPLKQQRANVKIALVLAGARCALLQ